MNYLLKKGIPIATTDLTNALNFLQSTNSDYKLNLNNVILIGFSAGAHIATNVGVSRNNREYPNQLDSEINIAGIINFSGPVDGLGVVEKIFSDSDIEMMSEIGKALFSSTAGHASKETIAVYEPITYFEKNDPPFFYGMEEMIIKFYLKPLKSSFRCLAKVKISLFTNQMGSTAQTKTN